MTQLDLSAYQTSTNGPLTSAAKQRLNEQRTKKSLTYKQLGAAIGMSGTFAHNLLNNNANVASMHIPKIAAGILSLENSTAAPVAIASASNTARTIAHVFNLRTDFALSIKLPADLSSDERERLSLFIRSLPVL